MELGGQPQRAVPLGPGTNQDSTVPLFPVCKFFAPSAITTPFFLQSCSLEQVVCQIINTLTKLIQHNILQIEVDSVHETVRSKPREDLLDLLRICKIP